MSLSADNAAAVRLAHFSDIHVTCRPLGWQREDWFNKRFPAWLNLCVLGRALRFRVPAAMEWPHVRAAHHTH